jgi:hypothetical protein
LLADEALVNSTDEEVAGRRLALEAAGAVVVPVPRLSSTSSPSSPQLDLRAAMERLVPQGINSIMVEGGAVVLHSFLRQHVHSAAPPSLRLPPLVHRVIITIAPFLLPGGLHIGDSAEGGGEGEAPKVALIGPGSRWVAIGNDMMLQGSPAL